MPVESRREPKNLCSACGVDFSTLSLFDKHRELWRINRFQELTGRCLGPQELGLVEFNGAFYTPGGVNEAKRMSELGRSRAGSKKVR